MHAETVLHANPGEEVVWDARIEPGLAITGHVRFDDRSVEILSLEGVAPGGGLRRLDPRRLE